MSYKKTICVYFYLIPGIIVLLSSLRLQSQNCFLKGKVTEEANLEAIAFANVMIIDKNKVLYATATD